LRLLEEQGKYRTEQENNKGWKRKLKTQEVNASRNLGHEVLQKVVTTVRDTMGTVELANSDDVVMVTALFSGTVHTDVGRLFEGSFGQCRGVYARNPIL
jgi:hypothetical protein